MSHLRKEVLGRNMKGKGAFASAPQNYGPVKWSVYFDSEEKVKTSQGTFHIYKKGQSGPLIVCLHGGGYSGLTWALFAAEIYSIIECQVLAIDLRGHGNTQTKDDLNLALTTMARDVVDMLGNMYEEMPPVVLVGHSMGGAVAVECSERRLPVVGLCVIDVVEGTALEALSSMQSILRMRPKSFSSISSAIQWCHKSGQTHNIEAAKVSMPGQIINVKTKNLAANECDTVEETISVVRTSKKEMLPPPIPSIPEEEAPCSACGRPPLPKTAKTDVETQTRREASQYIWRIDLSETEQFWSGWFEGLSEKFLDGPFPKLLLLANINGLDTKLTVGQMQGKFQFQVLSRSGHAIHEDQPQHVAEIIGVFLVKQKITMAKVDLASPMPGC